MARTTPGVTRQRIVDAATTLFSTKGFAATSVADIQVACGLTAGSGALYKHFPSKHALLSEIVRQHLESIADGRRDAGTLPDDPRETLELVAPLIWAALDTNRDHLRIIFRELEPFPDLLEQMWHGVSSGLYETTAEWIRDGVAAGRMTVTDPDATAAVLLASLTYYRILHALIGKVPGDVSEDAFLTAWIDHAIATLRGGR